MSPKILGIIVAKDEEEVISISVTHALLTLCDKVCILVHNSQRSFAEEVSRLVELWPDKITVFELNIKHFYQESAIKALRHYARSDDFDWIYVFDADEFAVTQNVNLFRRYLDSLPAEIDSVRYGISNWVSKRDFDSSNLLDWLDLDTKSVACLKYPQNSELCRNEVFNGFFNFFDLAFPSKVIFRMNSKKSLTAGSHNLFPNDFESEKYMPEEIFSVAHFPLLTFERLKLKRNQGQQLKDAGFPYVHGWQSQMIDDIFKIKQEKDFWAAHSTGPIDYLTKRVRPTTIRDKSFHDSIKSTVEYLLMNPGVSKRRNVYEFEDVSDSVLIYEGMRKSNWS
jgi:hypothetical protein